MKEQCRSPRLTSLLPHSAGDYEQLGETLMAKLQLHRGYKTEKLLEADPFREEGSFVTFYDSENDQV